MLQVEAEASTDGRPIPGFVPRRGAGLPFGILGISSTEPPARPNMRVDFQFDRWEYGVRLLGQEQGAAGRGAGAAGVA